MSKCTGDDRIVRGGIENGDCGIVNGRGDNGVVMAALKIGDRAYGVVRLAYRVVRDE